MEKSDFDVNAFSCIYIPIYFLIRFWTASYCVKVSFILMCRVPWPSCNISMLCCNRVSSESGSFVMSSSSSRESCFLKWQKLQEADDGLNYEWLDNVNTLCEDEETMIKTYATKTSHGIASESSGGASSNNDEATTRCGSSRGRGNGGGGRRCAGGAKTTSKYETSS